MKGKRTIFIISFGFLLIIFSITAYAAKYVASVDGKPYTSFQTAINNMKNNQTLTLLTKIKTNKTVNIKAGKKIININFAGNEYRYTGKGTAFKVVSGKIAVRGMRIRSNYHAFKTNKGTSTTFSGGNCWGLIENKGTMLIKSGTLSSQGCLCKNTEEDLIENSGILTISGGKITGIVGQAIIGKKGRIIINGGSISGKYVKKNDDIVYPVIFNGKNSKITVNKGTIRSKGCAFANEGKAYLYGGQFQSSQEFTVVNDGKMIIDGPNIQQKSKKIFTIANLGNLTIDWLELNGSIINYTATDEKLIINDGSFKALSGSEVINNQKGTIIINGGFFSSKKFNTVYNREEGYLKVAGGTFTSTGGYYALWNEGNSNLKGGVFKTSGGDGNSIGSAPGSTMKKGENVVGKVIYK